MLSIRRGHTQLLVQLFAGVVMLWVCVMTAVAGPLEFTGVVVAVLHGDTIIVLHNGRSERVRLKGIECREKRQAFRHRARDLTMKLALGRMVTVKPTSRDRQARTIADVTLPDGRLLQYELVKAGLAGWSFSAVEPRLSGEEEK